MPKLMAESLFNGSAKTSCNTGTGQPVTRQNTVTSRGTTAISRAAATQTNKLLGPSDLTAFPRTSYDSVRDRKPDCSYAVLIGIAMRAARAANCGERLPVIDIYRFIEKEFPYFKKCGSTGWKNCVRHCLSLGQFFRKVERAGEQAGMKGNYWEVIPGKKDMLDRDIELFMIEERKRVTQHNLRLGNRHLLMHSSIQPRDLARQQTDLTRPQELPYISYVIAQPAPPSTAAGAIHHYSESSESTNTSHYPPDARHISSYTGQQSPRSAMNDSVVPNTTTLSEEVSPGEQREEDSEFLETTPSITALVESVERELRQAACFVEPGAGEVASSNEVTPSETRDGHTSNTVQHPGCKLEELDYSTTDEENPMINPTHPIVTESTLTSLNFNIPSRAYCTTTKTTVTYVTAPSNSSTTLCSSTASNHPSHNPLYCEDMTTNTLNSNTTFHCGNTIPLHPRPTHLPQYLHTTSTGVVFCGRLPPAITPVLTHMHHPSLFLPSSLYYTLTPHYISDCTGESTSSEQQGKRDDQMNHRLASSHSQRERPHQLKGTHSHQPKRRERGKERIRGKEGEHDRERWKEEEVEKVREEEEEEEEEEDGKTDRYEWNRETVVNLPHCDNYFAANDDVDLVIAREEEVSTTLG